MRIIIEGKEAYADETIDFEDDYFEDWETDDGKISRGMVARNIIYDNGFRPENKIDSLEIYDVIKIPNGECWEVNL